MKFTYDQVKDKFYLGDKEVKPYHKDFMNYVCEFTINHISEGNSLAVLFPLESQVAPTLASIFTYIESNKKLAESMAKAEQARERILKEQLLKAADDYRQTPSADKREVFKALDSTFTSMRKSSEDQGNVIIKFNRILPEDFWNEREVKVAKDKK